MFTIAWVFAGIVTGSHQTNKVSVSWLGHFLCGHDGVVGRARRFGRVVEILYAHVSGAKDVGFGDTLRGEWKPERTVFLLKLQEMRLFRPHPTVLPHCALH